MTPENASRRAFLTRTSALGVASFFGIGRLPAAEPALETTRIRFGYDPVICVAPMFLAEELLHAEGFTEVEYVRRQADETFPEMLLTGKADLGTVNTPSLMLAVDAGQPIVMIAGSHVGCFELFANESVQAIRDLKGKRIAISGLGSGEHVYIASMLAYVGMDPRRDVQWVNARTVPDSMRLFVEGGADAFLGFPPQPQQLRSKKVGHVIVNTTLDRPWSQYFCCMVAARQDFAHQYPIATKRALRAMLKATDICASQPERAAQYLVTKGYETHYEVALEVVKSLPYRQWRDYQPEDTVRFHALRLYDAGMIKTNPKKLIAHGTDWRFLNELKQELKA
jgi:NitT/TauT family transport system substrate-binding protein